jgi:asparagine synthase (glutamine-hydrolysing)
LGIPDKYKKSFQPKKLLVDSLFPLLPTEILNRPKMGFTFPWESWLKNELEPFVTISIYSLAARRIFDSKNLISFYEKFKCGDKNITWNKIWLLVVLENWLSKHDL